MKLWNVPRKESGFTLIEVLAVTVIIGIIGAIAVPNVLGQLNKARISDGVAQIEGAFKEAKRQATSRKQSCTIQIANVGGNVIVQNQAGSCLLETRQLPDGVTVGFNTTNDSTIPLPIQFSGKGNIGNTDTYIPSNTGSWTITVAHDDIDSPKCLEIAGLFGDIQTGVVQGGNCNTDLN